MDWLVDFYRAYGSLINFVGINGILALSVYASLAVGQFSMAQAGFMSLAGYTTGSLTKYLDWPAPAGFAVAVAFSAAIGLLLGYPALRLRGLYLAIATLAFGEVVQVLVLNLPFTGRSEGMKQIPAASSTWLIYVSLAVLIYIFWRFDRSREGLAARAIQADEGAAETNGIDLTRYQLAAFVVGAALAGYAGALTAHLNTFLSPDQFSFNRAVLILEFAVIGGLGSFIGPLLGAILLTLLPEILRFLGDYREAVNGVILLLTILFVPGGLYSILNIWGRPGPFLRGVARRWRLLPRSA